MKPVRPISKPRKLAYRLPAAADCGCEQESECPIVDLLIGWGIIPGDKDQKTLL
ncbi:MAG TPA: hypothetical protein HPP83_08165 [Candidatus Hydrogenedentes bacterium]|nr:hypothetical protein [Candidatus Hydrogenedentota bacterium]